MKKFLSIAIAACLTLGLLSGCASTAPVDNTATPAPTAGADGEAAVTRAWAGPGSPL